MKTFNRIFAAAACLLAIAFIGFHIYAGRLYENTGKSYLVEAKRLGDEIAARNNADYQPDLSEYPSITAVERLGKSDLKTFIEGSGGSYLIKEINGEYYRFDYRLQNEAYRRKLILTADIFFVVLFLFVAVLFLYIKHRLLIPFKQFRNLPYELSKGNLTLPIKENKNRFFGSFLWGMDLLREKLELQKADTLKLQKEKKTLILSLSHDIKTPLSAIKLYAKALSKNIYDTAEKKMEIAEKINEKADEIEIFLSQITQASQEDFLNLSVEIDEFYMSETIKEIQEYYLDKLNLLRIPFHISPYSDCLLKGDKERAVEILQNILENAIKYSDGNFISIDLSDEENCRLITVSNSGCTLLPSELPHIFDSFWRGSNTGSNSGSGLGLYICRQLIHKMDGEIFAERTGDEIRITVLFRKV